MRILCMATLAILFLAVAFCRLAGAQEYDGGAAAAQARVNAQNAATAWPDALQAYASTLNQPKPEPARTQTCTTRLKQDVYNHWIEVTTCQ